jgi:2-keto-4-pentenoate hydratase
MSVVYEKAAEKLLEDHASGVRFSAFSEAAGIDDLDAAYAVQDCFVRLLKPRFGAKVGYKIGVTSKVMQEMAGIDQPIGGHMLETRVMRSGESVSMAGYGRAGVEFEIAARLGREITSDTCPATREEMAAAVEAVAPAFEIIDDRNAEYGAIDILSIVADNSWNAGAVLGQFTSDWPDLGAIRGTATINGEALGEGHGADVLGHPLEPLLWLARHVTARGDTLPRGAVVLTGSMIATHFPKPGDRYRFELEGLGDVEMAFDGTG